eukprot:296036_1
MGNKNTTRIKTTDDKNTIKMYYNLINMGFNEHKAMEAATKYPTNLNKAIDYLQNHKPDLKCEQTTILNDDKKNSKYHKQKLPNDFSTKTHAQHMNNNSNDITSTNDECIEYGDECKDISKCAALNVLVSELKYYKKYDCNNEITNDDIISSYN